MASRSVWITLAVTGCVLVLPSCSREEGVEEGGGFDGDARPSFQADNPYEDANQIAWRPWTDDVFGGDRPILLDIGGLWCHWCHIYDSQVYASETIRGLIEDNFIPVKVDPDARPDLDDRYRHGGWPTLSVLTPDGDPVVATGYDPQNAAVFLSEALTRYQAGGDTLRTRLREQRETVVRNAPIMREPGALDATVLPRVLDGFRPRFDRTYGGFVPVAEGAPKLVAARALTKLVRVMQTPGIEQDLEAFLRRTLEALSGGAVRDHLHGGWFRTTDDAAWSVPHFEKLLSAQTEIAELFLAGAGALDGTAPAYHAIVRETIEFVLDTMGNPDGVTVSNAIDADVGPGDDGSFYTWTLGEVNAQLGADEVEVVRYHFGIAHTGEIPGRTHENTIYLSFPPEESAQRLGIDMTTFESRLESAKARMRAYRLSGLRPRIDSTAYAAPNLRFAALLLAAAGPLEKPAYRDRALAIIDFFTETERTPDGVPHRSDGRPVSGPSLLRNQVAAIEACLAAHRHGGGEGYLARARAIYGATRTAFRNEITGVFWDTPTAASGPGLLAIKMRPMPENVRLAEALMDLFEITDEPGYRVDAGEALTAFSLSFGAAGYESLPYAVAVHRLMWELREGSS